MHVHPPVPPFSFPFPAKAWDSTGVTWAHGSLVGLRLIFMRLEYKAEPETGGNPLLVPCTPVLFFSSELVLLWTPSKLSQTARGGDKHLGNSWRWPTSRRQHRQRSLKCRGRWCSVSQILTSLFLKISLKVSRLRLYSFLNEYIKILP